MGTGEMDRAAHAPTAPVFERFDDKDVRALIDAYPLAWVCAGAGGRIEASQLPLVGVYDEAGRLTDLIGHLARNNPLCRALERDPGATILFSGPNAYVSPEHAARRDWAPTWNYAHLRVQTEMRLDESETENSLCVLIEAMEAHRDQPWAVVELGDRYPAMLERIIGFRAPVIGLHGKFKLCQDESPETLGAILDRLAQPDMVQWIRRFNEGR